MSAHARYRVRHETRYAYASKATSAHQLAHLKPRDTPWQRLKYHSIEIDPRPAECAESVDYFGNGVVRLMIDAPHDVLSDRRAFDTQQVSPPMAPAPARQQGWFGPHYLTTICHYF